MAETTEDSPDWIFESVLQFLKSPLWTSPVHGFIEENCGVFDPNEEENKVEYLVLHKKFCELVDGLLSNFLSDLGVTFESFIHATRSGRCPELSELVMEFIVSMDDFRTFRAMMERKNHELDLEAMHQYACLVQGARDAAGDEDLDPEERFLVEMAIKASLYPDAIAEKQALVDDAEVLQALAMSIALEHERLLAEQKKVDDAAEKERLERESHEKLNKLQQETLCQRMEIAERLSKMGQQQQQQQREQSGKPEAQGKQPTVSEPPAKLRELPPAGHGRAAVPFGGYKPLPGISGDIALSQPPLSQLATQVAAPAASTAPPERTDRAPTEEEIKQRAVYMKAQRDALLRAKSDVRTKELSAAEQGRSSSPGATVKSTASTLDTRHEIARRFKEDLILEARKAAAAASAPKQ